MGKLNSHIAVGKSVWKQKHFKVKGFLNFSYEAKTHEWISIVREKHGKHKSFKSMGFLNISGEAEIHAIPKIWGKWIYLVPGKYAKTEISHILPYLADLELTWTNAVPNV